MSMGFAEGAAKTALLRSNNDINRAADLLSNGSEFLVAFIARYASDVGLPPLLTYLNHVALLPLSHPFA